MLKFKTTFFLMSMILFLGNPTFASHLGSVNLSGMSQIYSEGTPGEIGYFRFLFDAASDNYYIEYVGESDDGHAVTEISLFEPTTKIDPILSVVLYKVTDGCRYTYSLRNREKAKQDIFIFSIQISEETGTLHRVSDKPSIIPVANIGSPAFWGTTSNDIWFGWGNMQEPPFTEAVKPGGLKSGFSFESPYLPKITQARFFGETSSENISRSKKFPIEPPGSLMKAYRRFLQNDANTFVVRKTLAPLANPPEDRSTICDTFILDLIGQVREAASLGWIKHDLRKDDDKGKGKSDDKGVKKGQDGDDHADDDVEMDEKDKGLPGAAKSTIKKLTKVRRECLRGKFGNAREKLRALIRQVTAQRGRHLTDEAFFLIKFNAEFLLEKL